MIGLQKQQGFGMLKLIVLISVCAFIGKFAFTVVPLYYVNSDIVRGLKDLAESDVALDDMSDSQIRAVMEKFYTVNSVRIPAARKMVIVRNASNVVVKIDYDTRANFIYNIDFVLHFDNHLDSAHPTRCCSPIAEAKSVNY